jgi:8-oxo-dGTP pyrophosphatase MutT (NUDIX family)
LIVMDVIGKLRGRLGRAGAAAGGDWSGLADDGRVRKPAAVLVPLVVRDGGLTVLLTRRTSQLHHHAGQISFPGGGTEAGDRSPEETAMREAREEIGLAAGEVELIGRLPEYFTGTGFRVTPVVGLVQAGLDLGALHVDRFEVDEVFEVPLAHFLDPANHRSHHVRVEGENRQFHAMPYGDYFIWGATAGMLMMLYRVLERESDDREQNEPAA